MFFVNYLPEFLYQPLKLSNVRPTDFANSKHAHPVVFNTITRHTIVFFDSSAISHPFELWQILNKKTKHT